MIFIPTIESGSFKTQIVDIEISMKNNENRELYITDHDINNYIHELVFEIDLFITAS